MKEEEDQAEKAAIALDLAGEHLENLDLPNRAFFWLGVALVRAVLEVAVAIWHVDNSL